MSHRILSNNFVIYGLGSNGAETIIYGNNQENVAAGRKPRNAKSTRTRSTIPIFEKMLDIAEKGFWKDLIQQFSVNNIQKSTTRNLHFDGKCLVFNNKSSKSGATLNLEESEKRPLEVIYNELITFLKKYDIKPAKERKEDDRRINEIYIKTDMSHINSFKQLKNLKKSAIFDFLSEKAEKYEMTKEEKDLSLEKITLGYVANILNDQTILVKEGKITKITNLKWDRKKREFWFKYEDSQGNKTFKMPRLSAKKPTANQETTYTSYTTNALKVSQKEYGNPDLSRRLDIYLSKMAAKLSSD